MIQWASETLPEDDGLSVSMLDTSCRTAWLSDAERPQALLTAPSACSRDAPESSSHLGDSGNHAYRLTTTAFNTDGVTCVSGSLHLCPSECQKAVLTQQLQVLLSVPSASSWDAPESSSHLDDSGTCLYNCHISSHWPACLTASAVTDQGPVEDRHQQAALSR